MSNKLAGIDVLLKTGAVSGSTTVLGGQTGATLNRSTNMIEVTSKDGEGWQENLAGIKSWSIDCDGFLVSNDSALEELEDAWLNGTEIAVDISYAGKQYTGNVLVSDFPSEFPVDDAVTFSLSLTGTGKLSKNPS
jgi:TP901-1 family phage major tail protein